MNEIALPTERSSRSPKTWLIIATVLEVPGIFVGAGLTLMSAMMFDAPGSDKNQALIMLALSFVAFPFSCLVAIPCMWIAFAAKWFRTSVWLSLLPLLPVISAIIAILWWQFGHGGDMGR